jgi:hypothetical protein
MVNLAVPHFSTAAPQGATRRTFHPPFTKPSTTVAAFTALLLIDLPMTSLTTTSKTTNHH